MLPSSASRACRRLRLRPLPPPLLIGTARIFPRITHALRPLSSLSSSPTTLPAGVARRAAGAASRRDVLRSALSDPATGSPSQDIYREISSLDALADAHARREEALREIAAVESLREESAEDPEMREECDVELEALRAGLVDLEASILDTVLAALVRGEEDGEGDAGGEAILEVRPGTGGDEAGLFAWELFRAYERAAARRGWGWDVLNSSRTEIGGLREGSVHVSARDADGAFAALRWENGVHRVQRVPVNDARVHTSAVTVAVLPAPAPSESRGLIPLGEMKIDVMRSSGAGGQHVNTTESAVRMTHVETGITASIQDERSQHQNKAKAHRLVSARVAERRRQEEAERMGKLRKGIVGSGARSERIRTYNFPQDRCTDHRCKHSEHGLMRLLQGDADGDGGDIVDCFAPHMEVMYREELLAALDEEGVVEAAKAEGGRRGRKG